MLFVGNEALSSVTGPVEKGSLRPALVHFVYLLHLDRLLQMHLHKSVSRHTVWARGNSTGLVARDELGRVGGWDPRN